MNTLPISPSHIPAAERLLQEANCPLPACPQGLVLEKEGEVVGVCLLGGTRVEMLAVASAWRRRGYGSFLLRRALHALGAFAGKEVTAALPADEAGRALLAKFGFVPRGAEMVRPVRRQLTALELGPRGVTCNAICPGATDSPLLRSTIVTSPEIERAWIEKTALKRLGTPEDQARVAVFLGSRLSDHMTGESLVVSAGELMTQ